MGQAPRNMKETPRQMLTAATKPMSTAKPRGPRLRCGVRIASNATAVAGALGATGDASDGAGMTPTIQGRARGRQRLLRVGIRRYTRRMPKPKVDADAFFRRLAAANPDPRGELDYINPYTLLVAVVLSAQATDASVNKATEPLFKVADTPQKMLALGEARLK